ncbi:LRR receptor kinase BAK1 [Eucalyptus grandis]|uniref:LRR receptor kinase BAK1 n=1 Tax=Eucalyptus grandis TaxID=71139 RepID=UPI00192EEE7A|nr:LRR receptor kinase BAK1 [Eucalyptus grandis]
MVFKFATFDPSQDPNDFNPAFPPTPSPSPSVTLCQPCEHTYTFTKTIVRRLAAAGASLVLRAPAFAVDGREIQDQSAETPLHSIHFDVHPEFGQRQLKEFTLKELEAATQKFSDKKVIGRGGFGEVYEGQLSDGSLVAIKRCGAQSNQGITEFESENIKVQGLIARLPFDDQQKCGPLLESEARDTTPLDWLTRRKIALGAARGLSWLHDLNIVHRDIKPANILLDEEFEPHIADFGLVRFTNRRHGEYSVDGIEEAPVLPRNKSEAASRIEDSDSYFTNRICGTFGYMAPEYGMKGKYSVKTDVFSYGVVLLQLVTGQRTSVRAASAKENDMLLPDWVKGLLVERRLEILVDPNLQGEYDEEMEKVIQLALLCTHTLPRGRPSMAQVVRILEGDSIEERWEEYRHSEEYLVDSEDVSSLNLKESSVLSPEELSGPR